MPKSSQINEDKLSAMREGGARLRQVKQDLVAFTKVGTSFADIEFRAQHLIAAAGARPNFTLVPGYHWATCVMKNEEVCHGIPRGKVVEDGDLISIDVGLLYQGWHLDTSVTFGVGRLDADRQHFLEVGRRALKKAIAQARVGKSVYHVSKAMQTTVEKAGYNAVFQLTGHGIGRELHMEPSIPCVALRQDKRERLSAGQTIAIEIMYTQGNAFLQLAADGWTYRTADGSISGMFEETVLVTQQGPEVLT